MATLKNVFELVTPEIGENGNRFITLQTERETVNVIDLATVDNIEIDIKSKHIWLGKENYINFQDLLYQESIEEFFAKLVNHWIDYKLKEK
jgi:hypothetical protein